MMLNLSDNLIRLRLEQNLSRRSFCNRFNADTKADALISVDNVGNWERGHCQPSIQALKAIAAYYGITIDALCYRALRFNIQKQDHDNTPSKTKGEAPGRAMLDPIQQPGSSRVGEAAILQSRGAEDSRPGKSQVTTQKKAA